MIESDKRDILIEPQGLSGSNDGLVGPALSVPAVQSEQCRRSYSGRPEPPQDAQQAHRASVWAALQAYHSGAGHKRNRLQTKKPVKYRTSKRPKVAL